MDEVSLRAAFHMALDDVAPPKPWLAGSVLKELHRRHTTKYDGTRRRSWLRFIERPLTQRLIAVVLVLLIGVAAAGLWIFTYGHVHSTIPVHPPVHAPHAHLPSTFDCAGYQPASAAPVPVKPVSTTAVWGTGALLSSDGGVHWRDTSPSALRQDEPTSLPRSQLPPGFADFYLDANHAWLARGVNFGSNTSCYDHVVLYTTSNGGKTWDLALPIAVNSGGDPFKSPAPCRQVITFRHEIGTVSGPTPSPSASPAPCPPKYGFTIRMSFLDGQHGWLIVHPLGATTTMYATVDGGYSWHLLAGDSPPDCPFIFTSTRTGWMGSDSSASCDLMRTDDGGTTWTNQQLPCSCSVPYELPAFLGQQRGVLRALQDVLYGGTETVSYVLLGTSDGGRSWQLLHTASDAYVYAIDYAGANDLWVLLAPPGWRRGAPGPTDWLYHSADGGASWKLVQRDTPIGYTSPINAFSLWFVDSRNGFVVQAEQPTGNYPQLLVTHDGGHTWQVVHEQAP